MNFTEYQELANATAQYPQQGNNAIYPALGLTGEAGEAADKVKKIWRNQGISNASAYSTEQKTELAKELGDVLWYIAAFAYELKIPMNTIAVMNIEKLQDRVARNVVLSEGDNR